MIPTIKTNAAVGNQGLLKVDACLLHFSTFYFVILSVLAVGHLSHSVLVILNSLHCHILSMIISWAKNRNYVERGQE